MNRSNQTASTTVKAVIALAIVVVVAVGAWYFTSDTFRTKVDASMKQATKWTPENIAKDPQNYLNYVENETIQAQDSLKASRIAVAQNRGKLETMRDDAKRKIAAGEKGLKQLLDSYKAAETGNSFPVTWNGRSMAKDQVQQQVVALDKEVKIQKNLQNKVEGGLKSLDVQVMKISEAEGNAQSQLAEIRANRELLKVQSLTTDLKDKLVSMQSAVAATVGAASDTSSVMSLDQLTASTETAVDTTAFDKILQDTK